MDDFVHLGFLKTVVDRFPREELLLETHPDKSGIRALEQGIPFSGFRIFFHHKLPSRKNLPKIKQGAIAQDESFHKLQGWLSYLKNARTYALRQRLSGWLSPGFHQNI